MKSETYQIVIILIIIGVICFLFTYDIGIEYFENNENRELGQCLSPFSKNRLKVKLFKNSNNRNEDICPNFICKYDDDEQKCLPNDNFKNNAVISEYCNKESYMPPLSDKKICEETGYTFKNDKCITSPKRTQETCPTDLCEYVVNRCQAKEGSADYDAVNDYCLHLKALPDDVSKKTCQNAGSRYQYNDLIQKCVNVDIDPNNSNDNCWGKTVEKDCLNSDENCLWIPYMSNITNPSDLTDLRESELKSINQEVLLMETNLNKLMNELIPYQKKMDEEQSTKLVYKLVKKDDKDRYKLETGINQYDKEFDELSNLF